ncbi:MAG: YraN family protein [Alphaproteobacteria bacterium]|nr:YraN family protein [Alphaproteobacteria bacterium]
MTAAKKGYMAEEAAVWYLRLKGWRILERRFVTGRGSGAGEVDIIARRGSLLAFIEVKARASEEAAAQAIGPRQQGRISRAAEAYLARHGELANLDIRFDAVLVGGAGWLSHIEDAWRP